MGVTFIVHGGGGGGKALLSQNKVENFFGD